MSTLQCALSATAGTVVDAEPSDDRARDERDDPPTGRSDSDDESLLTTVKLEDVVPANHPLRPIRAGFSDALAKMDEARASARDDARANEPAIAAFRQWAKEEMRVTPAPAPMRLVA